MRAALGPPLRGACSHPASLAVPGRCNPRRQPRPCRTTALPVGLQEVLAAAQTPHPGLAAGALVNSAVYAAGMPVLLRGLTPAGVAHSWVLGTSVFSAFGAGGYLLVCLYFLLGTLVTRVKLKQKQAEGIAEERSGRRGPGSVWGSGAAALACALVALGGGGAHPWQTGFVASLVSKLSDTVSSEIGKAYGRTTYLVTTLERVPRGTEGAVSAEGTAAGVVAAVLFSGVACAVTQVDVRQAGVAAAAAVAANIFESYLGALAQGRWAWLTNDVVNMMQISVAAGLAVGTQQLLLP